MDKWEDRFRALVERYDREIIVAALFGLSVLIRVDLAPRTAWSGDYLYCIVPWVERYRSLGIAGGLATGITNYYIPYNVFLAVVSLFPMEPWVLVSILSCLAEYLGVVYAYRILRYLGGEAREWRAVYAAVALLYLPPMILNGALWKQCDAVYAAFGLMALYYLLRDCYYRAFLFLSIAFVLKLQAILLLPVFVIAYFCGKRYPLALFLRIPVTYLEAGLPAILCGRPAGEVYSIYLNQSQEYHFMFLNTGNLYRIFRSDYEAVGRTAVYATLAFLAVLFGFCVRNRARMDGRRLLQTAAVSAYGCFLFLPAMHERYDYLPLLLVSMYYGFYERRRLYVPALMAIVTTVMYCEYLFGGNTLPEEVYALMNLGAFTLAARDLIAGLSDRLIGVGHTMDREVSDVDQDQ